MFPAHAPSLLQAFDFSFFDLSHSPQALSFYREDSTANSELLLPEKNKNVLFMPSPLLHKSSLVYFYFFLNSYIIFICLKVWKTHILNLKWIWFNFINYKPQCSNGPFWNSIQVKKMLQTIIWAKFENYDTLIVYMKSTLKISLRCT